MANAPLKALRRKASNKLSNKNAKPPMKPRPVGWTKRVEEGWDSRFVKGKMHANGGSSATTASSYRTNRHQPAPVASAPSHDPSLGHPPSSHQTSATGPSAVRDTQASLLHTKKMDAARAVGYRESLLLQLTAVITHWPSPKSGKGAAPGAPNQTTLPEAARLLRNMSVDLRTSGLRCVEKIVSWVLAVSVTAATPHPFLWNGTDYLLKMSTDLDFVHTALGAVGTKIASFCPGNPLLLSRDEIKGKGSKTAVNRAHAASIVILDVVRRDRKNNTRREAEEKARMQPVSEVPPPPVEDVIRMATPPPTPPSVQDSEPATSPSPVKQSSPSPKLPSPAPKQPSPAPKQSPPAASPPAALPVTPVAERAHDAEVAVSSDEEDYEEEEYDEMSASEVIDAVDATPLATPRNEPDFMSPIPSKTPIPENQLGNYAVGKLLGEGAYGYVYLATEKKTGTRRAIKKFKAAGEDDEDAAYVLKTQEREVAICHLLKHETVVHAVDDFVQAGVQYLIFEMMEMNVLELIESHEHGIGPSVVKNLMRQLLVAVEYCHQNGIVHRDIKPENILLKNAQDPKPTLKLCDFGAARELDKDDKQAPSQRDAAHTDLTHYVGSRWYRAPELLGNSASYGRPVDVWSCACIMAELATGNALFQGDDEAEVVQYILECNDGSDLNMETLRALQQREVLGDVYKAKRTNKTRDLRVELGKLGKRGVKLVAGMLEIEETKRLTAAECGRHKYFDDSAPSPRASPISPQKEEYEEEEYEEEEYEEECEDDAMEESKQQESAPPPALPLTLTATHDAFDIITHAPNRAALKSALLDDVTTSTAFRQQLDAADLAQFKCFMDAISPLASPAQLSSLANLFKDGIDYTCTPRVDSCKEWMLKQQRSDMTLEEVVTAVEDDVGAPLRQDASTNATCLDLLHHLKTLRPDLDFNVRSVNNVLSLISALLLDAEVSIEQKEGGLKKLQSLLGIPSLTAGSTLTILTPTSKSIFLYLALSRSGISRLTLTTWRDAALVNCSNLLRHAGYLDSDRNEATVICPYYRSDYGKKRSEGLAVEEGEGLGPRKELFVLVSEQFTQKHRKRDGVKVVCSGTKGSNVVSVADGGVDQIKIGCLLKWGELHGGSLVTRVDARKGEVAVERALAEALRGETCEVHESCTPLLVYKKEGECLWINGSVNESEEVRNRFTVLGILLGLSVVNQCQLDLDLPAVFFRVLLARKSFAGTVHDLAGFDGELFNMLKLVKRDWSDAQIREVLEMEGVTMKTSMPRDELVQRYEEHVLGGVFRDNIAWQIGAVKQGFFSICGRSHLEALSVAGTELKEITCGVGGRIEDFDFRQVFQVVTDTELSTCSELHDTFWEVVCAMSVEEKRKLLLFITGIDKLPSAGTEFLTIEMPFLPLSVDDHKKMLLMVPQSHTCDNILELPNYWEAICKVSENEGKGWSRAEKVERVRHILEEKLKVCGENAKGYGLDAIDGGGAGDVLGGGREEEKGGEDGDGDSGGSGDFDIPMLGAEGAGGAGGADESFDIPVLGEEKEEEEGKEEEKKGGEDDEEGYSDDSYGEESFD